MSGETSPTKKPTDPNTRRSANSGCDSSARSTGLAGWTGPPWKSGSPGGTNSLRAGRVFWTVTSRTRFRTTPSAPSALCSPTKTTVWRKFGSYRPPLEISRRPRRLSILLVSTVKGTHVFYR
jgi:hypothetical protein